MENKCNACTHKSEEDIYDYKVCIRCEHNPFAIDNRFNPKETKIIPQNAGELWKWKDSAGDYGHVLIMRSQSISKELMTIGSVGGRAGKIMPNMIHGQNGWTRLYPSVPDENVASIEIDCAENWKHIECFTSLNKCRYEVTLSNVMNKALTDKAPMKMTLTREKDKKEEL